MLAQIGLGLVLILALPAWGQDEPAAANPGQDSPQQAQMLAPPPVTGLDYSTALSWETEDNYFRTGLSVGGGYIHNLDGGVGTQLANDTEFLIQPTAAWDRTTARLHEEFSYNPAFLLYQPTSVLNSVNQSANADLRFGLSPHVSLRAMDTVQRSSAIFGMGTVPVTVSGSPGSVTPGVVAPYAPELTNMAGAVVLWQFGEGDMFAASGQLANLNFTNPSEAQGFYDTRNAGGAGAWSHRATDRQYLGAIGQYAQIAATPLSGEANTAPSSTATYSGLGFYTVYFRPNFSLSLVGGAEHYDLSQAAKTPARGWAETGTASLGWQGERTSVALSGSRAVTAGNGIIGAWVTNTGSGAGRWRIARTWDAGLRGSYSRIATVSPQFVVGYMSGGDTASGSVSLQHTLTSRLQFTASYTHLHQTYSGIPALASNPDSDQAMVSLSYLLTHPLGR